MIRNEGLKTTDFLKCNFNRVWIVDVNVHHEELVPRMSPSARLHVGTKQEVRRMFE